MVTLKRMVTYAIIIIVGLSILFVLYAPGKFTDSIRTTVSSIGCGMGLGIGTEELRTDYPEPSEGAVKALKNLADLFQRHQHSADFGCFIEYTPFDDFGNCWIEIKGSVGWTKLQLICLDENKHSYILSELVPKYKTSPFDFTPISVGGSIFDLQKSQNFYDNWIIKKGISPFSLPEYIEVRNAVLKPDEFFEGTLYSNFPYLYKADKDHIGFVVFENCAWWWWTCTPCEKGLDEHCRGELLKIARKNICKQNPEVET